MSTWLLLGLLVVVNSAIWAFFDAARLREAHHTGIGPSGIPPQTWAAAIFLVWPVAFPYYLARRSDVENLELRQGPPPRFVTEGLNGFAVGVGLLGFAIFGGLVAVEDLKTSILGLIVAAAGIFGGRKTHMTREQEKVELGSIAFDQVGFSGTAAEGDEEGPAPEDVAQYFSSMRRVVPPLEQQRQAPAQPPEPPVLPEPAPRPAPRAGEPAPGVPYVPSFDAPPTSHRKPTTIVPPPLPPLPSQPSSPAAGPTTAPTGPTASQTPTTEPAVGVPYTPPLPGAPYSPEPSTPPQAQPVAPQQPAPPQPAAPQPATLQHAPLQPPAPGQAPQPTPPHLPAATAPPVAGRTMQHRAPSPATNRPAPAPPRPTTPRPPRPSAAANPYGYAAKAKPSPVSKIAGIGIGAALLTGLAWAVWTFWMQPTPLIESQTAVTTAADGAEESEPARPKRVPPRGRLVDVGTTSPPSAESPVTPTPGEAPAADPDEMVRWTMLYDRLMRPLATVLDDIDFNGIEQERCVELQRTFRRVLSEIGTCPDAEAESFFEPAFTNLHEVADACRAADETRWSTSLLETKRLIYRAQILLDERYQYLGISELELDSAIGVTRSPESISGRYLMDEAQQGFGGDFAASEDGDTGSDSDPALEEELFRRLGDG